MPRVQRDEKAICACASTPLVMSSIKVTIKPTSGGDKFQAEIETSATVRELKEEVARKCDTPADQQRLIYKGQVLKDDKTAESYGMLLLWLGSSVDRTCSTQRNSAWQAYRTSTSCIWSRPNHKAPRQGAATNSLDLVVISPP